MNFKCTFYQEIVFEFSQRCQRRKRKIKGNNKPQQQQFIIRSLQFLLETLSDEWGAVDMSIQLTFASFSGTPTRRLSSYKVVEK
jgi:hypothetical protein